MSMRILNRSFSGGEITPELFGRLDLPKVQESLALCRNFIALPHGPVVNRPGTEFVQEVKDSTQATRLIPFSYNNEQTFAIELGAGYFRFHTQAATLQYTAPAAYNAATAYNQGDMCSSGGVNYYCISPTTGNAPPNASYWYALPADLTYEIPNPYAAADLFDIHYTQSADVLTLVHPNYPILELRRYGAANWQAIPVSGFAPGIGIPSGSGSAGAPVTYNYKITITYVIVHTTSPEPPIVAESLPSGIGTCTNDLTQAGAYNTLNWSPVSYYKYGDNLYSPVGYNIYREEGGVYYYVGSSAGMSFVDDISKRATTRVPPSTSLAGGLPNPPVATPTTGAGFSNVAAAPTGSGSVSYSYVATAVGPDGSESYQSNVASCTNNLATAGNFNTITVPAVSGAVRYNVYKLSNGIYGYIGQIGAGSNIFIDDNITPDISLTPPLYYTVMSAPGDYPAAVAYYQQRRIFAGSTNQPQNVWATRSGTEYDMSYTIPTRDDNRLAFRIAGREASVIRHIVPMQDLLFLSASCEWRCTSSTGVLTPATLNVQPQSYIGANNVQPVVVGNAVLYAAARGGHIRQMGYNWQISGYESNDASIFAPHLFDYNTILDMAYSRGPVPILWCVSSTGKLLGMTWLPEQKIASWHQHDTGNGDAFESVCAVSENNEDMLYAIVRRTINGTSKRYVERLHTRLYATLADAHYVDCGATYTAPVVSGSYALSGNTLTCTIANHGLTSGNTYWFTFSDSTYGAAPGGQPYVVTVVDANTFTLEVTTAASASGTVTWLPNIVSGLTWLEGMAVNILADGAVLPQQTVSGGAVTFPVGVNTAHIGLPITAQIQTPPAAQTMDPAMGQGMVKNINKIFLRTWRSSGILAGPDFSRLVPYHQRTTENPGSPPNIVSDEIEIVLDAAWSTSGQVCIQQSDPLPLDIAAMTLEIATGGGV